MGAPVFCPCGQGKSGQTGAFRRAVHRALFSISPPRAGRRQPHFLGRADAQKHGGPKRNPAQTKAPSKKLTALCALFSAVPQGMAAPARPCRAPVFACGAEGRQENLFCRVGIKPGFLPARPGVGDQTGAFRRAAHQAPFSAPAARGDGSRRPFLSVEARSTGRICGFRAHRFSRFLRGKPPPQQSHPRPRAK